jgi:formylglycine-generating enzyme required for sulfatase activity
MYPIAYSCFIFILFSKAYAEDLAEPPPLWHSPADLAVDLVSIPAGEFRMGCVPERDAQATPCPAVSLPARMVKVKAFAIGRYEVSVKEWQQCVKAAACPTIISTDNARLPITGVSFEAVQRYIAWLNAKTGQSYRLPSEAEWEYAARANNATAYPWGNQLSCEQAHYDRDACQRTTLAAVDAAYPANAWGVAGTVGNAWEWVADCWHANYEYAPKQASAWTAGCDDAAKGVVRGGSYILKAADVRTLSRKSVEKNEGQALLGFRLAKTL